MCDHHSDSDRLHIVHLEDNENDRRLTGIQLKKEWPLVQIDQVEGRDEFFAVLTRGDLDLIISDYTIPGFTGLAALELTRRLRPDIPYIFFSGTIGDDRAVEALREGASDFVIKDRPDRLIPAVRQAVDQAHHLRRNPALVAFTDRIAHNFSNALVPILLGLPILREKVSDTGVSRMLDAVESSSQRGVDLVRQLHAYVRGEPTEMGAIVPPKAIKGRGRPKGRVPARD